MILGSLLLDKPGPHSITKLIAPPLTPPQRDINRTRRPNVAGTASFPELQPFRYYAPHGLDTCPIPAVEGT